MRYPICEWFETSLYTGYNLNYLKLDVYIYFFNF